MWIVYDPEQYFITGDHLREIENMIQVGDIVCRGYTSYLDGKFIPGKFSHSGIYVGNHTVIHAVAEGVEKIDFEGAHYRKDIGHRALDKTRSSANAVMHGTLSNYTSIKTILSSVQLAKESANYNLLPVWIYDYSYKGIKYPFYINGQTGKVVGLAPISGKKAFVYILTMFASIALIIVLILMLLFM